MDQLQKVVLHCPSLEEVATVLENGLKSTFANVEVRVVDCPDLTQKPYGLACPGLGGSPRIADVGGVPYLIPLPQKDKIYNLEKIGTQCEVPGGFVMGAGAGPYHHLGYNAEMIANIRTGSSGESLINETHVCSIDVTNGGYLLEKCPTTDFCLLANLFISEGKAGKVLRVKAEKRTGPDNFMSAMRKTLASHYGNQPVGLGGMFCVEKGKIRTHVMPNYSEVPLNCDEEVDNWLRFFEMTGPFTCLGIVMSHDPDLDLRMEHFHGYNEQGQGGHYHYDTTPEDVQYLGYLNVAQFLYRIDRPKETHRIGRD